MPVVILGDVISRFFTILGKYLNVDCRVFCCRYLAMVASIVSILRSDQSSGETDLPLFPGIDLNKL